MPSWHQYSIEFTDPATIEHTAARHLAPALTRAQHDGRIDTWWFIRKPPGLRLRYQTTGPGPDPVPELLDGLSTEPVAAWTQGIYEPETLAFGGPDAMTVAHTLFHHDSRELLERAAADQRPALGQRETTMLLYSALLRSAGLDWFEQGDTWSKVQNLRPLPTSQLPSPERAERLGEAIRPLMTANPASVPGLLPASWTGTFERAGQQLAALNRDGRLERGLRSVLAHHFIFHANRAGLSGRDQAVLAALAVNAVFHRGERLISAPPAQHTTKVRDMTTTTSDTAASADELRNQLADRLRAGNVIRTQPVEDAIRRVPRHQFIPGVPLTDAYADDAVYTKTDSTGASISAASQPTIVAMMLEQLQIQPGQRILELGAGTGYNAALMADITGEDGHVTAVDVDDDLVDEANKHLAAADVAGVDVVLADGALGHPDAAPYDRVIATVGAYEVPRPWLDQLHPEGRMVVPVRIVGAASRSIAFEADGHGGWTSKESRMAVFMPLRGIGDDSRRIIDLTGDGEVTLQTHQDNQHATSAAALRGVLGTRPLTAWTDVVFVPGESFEWLDLWLACRLPNPIMRMNVEAPAREAGLVNPMFPTVAMATTTEEGALAYLTIRPVDPADDGTRRYEVGVIGHGVGGQELAGTVARQVVIWDRDFRARTVTFAIPVTLPSPAPDHGRFVLARTNTPMTVTWE
ncbi:methyltransferase, FxLD system [Kitasatospora sp. NPDC098663]|uniref:methyltransferase, FxLD system n=1 Tax=Kitasatospora sp. NPDC098663 TaxID=3364096 RepID=UPI00380BE07B